MESMPSTAWVAKNLRLHRTQTWEKIKYYCSVKVED